MSEAGKKKLKVLMPEILPDPTPQHAEGGPRARTMATMQRLLSVAAATSALSAACTKEGSPPIKKEEGVPKGSDTTTSNTTSPSTSDTTATTDTTTTPTASTITAPTPPTTGYLVVDPMPPPAKCAGVAASITPSAKWVSIGTTLAVEITMPKSTRADARYGRKAPPTAYSGKIASVTWKGDDLVIRVIPDAGTTYFGVYVPAECSAGEEHVNAEISLSGGTPAAGTPVHVSLYDGY